MIKKIFVLSALVMAGLFQGFAQFVPGSPFLPETSVLPLGAEVVRPTQTFAYSMEGVHMGGSPQNLYLTTWSNGIYSGIHWRRATTLSTSPFTEGMSVEGMIQLSGSTPSTSVPVLFESYYDLSAVSIRDAVGDVYIIVTFYGATGASIRGHFAQIFRWDLAGVTYVNTIPLSSSMNYGRISIDAHKTYAATIVWEDNTELFMKGLLVAGGSGLTVGPTLLVPSPYRGYIPDVAFAHPDSDELKARVVFVNIPSLYPTVFHINFPDLMAGTPLFVLDDVNTDAFPAPFSPWGGSTFHGTTYPIGENLKIDCPDHSPNDEWAYVYTKNQSVVNLRGRQSPFPLTTINLTSAAPNIEAGFSNQQLAIHFNKNGRIYTGWRTNYATFSPGHRFVGKILNMGGPVAPFPVISNESYAYSSIAFSKQDDFAHCLFASYLYFNIPAIPFTGYDLKYKLKPFATGLPFAGKVNIGTAEQVLSVYPNPVTDRLNIRYSGDMNEVYEVSCTNLAGQLLLRSGGKLSELELVISESVKGWPAGIYNLDFVSGAGDRQSVKINKL